MKRYTLHATALGLMIVTVTGCATDSVKNSFCTAYQPVPTLTEGTEVQQLLTDENNAVYMELCD